MHVDPAVLSMMNFILTDDRIAAGANLNSSQRVVVDIVAFDQAAPFAKYVHATLMPGINFVFPKKTNQNDF